MADKQAETFEAFKDSFSYGSRTNLDAKFLKNLSAQDAAMFFEDLLQKLSESINDGAIDRLIQHVYNWQVRAYATDDRRFSYDERPFAPLQKPLEHARLALLTSSGHFAAGDDPQPFGVANMTQEEAMARIGDFLRMAPELSAIPTTIASGSLCVRHGGYDIRAAQQDPNVIFPLDRLREMADEGIIGELVSPAYSFVGAAAQTLLRNHVAPVWAEQLRDAGVDAVLLVPG